MTSSARPPFRTLELLEKRDERVTQIVGRKFSDPRPPRDVDGAVPRQPPLRHTRQALVVDVASAAEPRHPGAGEIPRIEGSGAWEANRGIILFPCWPYGGDGVVPRAR